jgi:nucleotidyltransferase/DNA polymerase involved in DNA repair
MKETTLGAMGYKVGADLRDRAADLMIAFTEFEYTFLIKCGMGLGQTRHGEDGSLESFDQKGISISETFRPRSTKEQFKEKIAELAEELSKRMQKDKLAGRVVMLGLKKTTFFGNTT